MNLEAVALLATPSEDSHSTYNFFYSAALSSAYVVSLVVDFPGPGAFGLYTKYQRTDSGVHKWGARIGIGLSLAGVVAVKSMLRI